MKIVRAVLITLATLLGPAGCDASTPPSEPHSGAVVEEHLQRHMLRLQTTNDHENVMAVAQRAD